MTKHTAGKWVVDGWCIEMDNEPYTMLAVMKPPSDGGVNLEECLANAALIARAPELAAEVEEAKRHIRILLVLLEDGAGLQEYHDARKFLGLE